VKNRNFYTFSLILLISANFIFCQGKANAQKNALLPDTTKRSAATAKDTSSAKKRPALIPLKISPLQEKILRNMTIRRNILEATDYRSTADFTTSMPFGFLRDFGSVGQPNESIIWGHGFNGVTFLNDGISINTRLSNSLDLNLFQSESIDSIEVIPLVRGFLFGGMNNPVAVNFMSREININKPYSKIKFYQAPNSEGMIDGLFCITPINRLNVTFEITNQSTSPYYKNTDLSNWLGSLRLRYLVNKDLNIFVGYKYHQTEVQLNGGVDVDSLTNYFDPSEFNADLYSNIKAPVRFGDRYQKVSGHNFNIRVLSNMLENAPTDVSLYYQTGLTEFRQNEYSTLSGIASIIDDNKSETIGANLRQDFRIDGIKLTSISNTERTKYDTPLLEKEIVKSHFSESAMAAFSFLDKKFEPTLFAKYLYYSNKSYLGFGADAIFEIAQSFKLFGGLSSFEKPYSVWEERFTLPSINLNKQRINTLEIMGSVENNLVRGTFGYFNQTTSNSLMPAIITPQASLNDKVVYYDSRNLSLQGINLKFYLKIWKILLLTNSSYYLSSSDRHDYNLPDFTSEGGVYYIDTVFNNNLRLKLGFNYYSIGKQDYSITDFEKSITSNYYYNTSTQTASLMSNSQFSSKIQLDLFIAGRIQKSAIVYIVWQNFLNQQYFIAPYYPKQPRSFRFGVAWEFLD
jgi:hypothetical protein